MGNGYAGTAAVPRQIQRGSARFRHRRRQNGSPDSATPIPRLPVSKTFCIFEKQPCLFWKNVDSGLLHLFVFRCGITWLRSVYESGVSWCEWGKGLCPVVFWTWCLISLSLWEGIGRRLELSVTEDNVWRSNVVRFTLCSFGKFLPKGPFSHTLTLLVFWLLWHLLRWGHFSSPGHSLQSFVAQIVFIL